MGKKIKTPFWWGSAVSNMGDGTEKWSTCRRRVSKLVKLIFAVLRYWRHGCCEKNKEKKKKEGKVCDKIQLFLMFISQRPLHWWWWKWVSLCYWTQTKFRSHLSLCSFASWDTWSLFKYIFTKIVPCFSIMASPYGFPFRHLIYFSEALFLQLIPSCH